MEQLFDMPSELRAILELVIELRRRLEADMHAVDSVDNYSADRQIRMLEKLTTSAARLGNEMRQWQNYQKTQLAGMSPAKQAETIVHFIQRNMPVAARRDLYVKISALEAERADGVPFQVVPDALVTVS